MSVKELSAAGQAISNDVQKALTGENGLNEKINSDIYYDHGKKAGYEPEVIDGVKNHDRTFAAGSMDAVAKVGLAHAQKADSTDPVTVTIGAAKGEELNVTYTPKSAGVMKGSEGQPDKPWESFGSVRATHKTVVRGKGGDMGAAIAASSAAAEAVFKKA